MKDRLKKSRKNVYAYNVTEKSIKTAVEYLVKECLRLNDLKGAKILEYALVDFSNKEKAKNFSISDEVQVIHILREYLRLNARQKEQFLTHLELGFEREKNFQ
jgi:hypothetical protein